MKVKIELEVEEAKAVVGKALLDKFGPGLKGLEVHSVDWSPHAYRVTVELREPLDPEPEASHVGSGG